MLELKSRFDGDIAIAMRAAAVLGGYAGPVPATSVHPRLVAALAWRAPSLVRGLAARRTGKSTGVEADRSGAAQTRSGALILEAMRARPYFVACRQQDLATAPALVARHLFRLPVLAWTVRSETERRERAPPRRPGDLRGVQTASSIAFAQT